MYVYQYLETMKILAASLCSYSKIGRSNPTVPKAQHLMWDITGQPKGVPLIEVATSLRCCIKKEVGLCIAYVFYDQRTKVVRLWELSTICWTEFWILDWTGHWILGWTLLHISSLGSACINGASSAQKLCCGQKWIEKFRCGIHQNPAGA